jgi:DNA uptake protein ComE-like DNA-binding protein
MEVTMSRRTPLSSFLVLALIASTLSIAHAQTSTSSTPSAAPKADAAAKSASATATKAADQTKSSAASASKETKKEAEAKASEMAKYDLNTASKDDLMKIPGIGTATADKIVAGRPWKQKSDLVHKGVMNKAMYDKASPYMIAHTTTAAKK